MSESITKEQQSYDKFIYLYMYIPNVKTTMYNAVRNTALAAMSMKIESNITNTRNSNVQATNATQVIMDLEQLSTSTVIVLLVIIKLVKELLKLY